MELVFLLVFLPVAHSVKHSLTYFVTASSGLQTVPEFMAVAVIDGVQLGYCDSNNGTAEFKQEWANKIVKDFPDHLELNTEICKLKLNLLKLFIQELQFRSNQTGGVHILQEINGCELDDAMKDATTYHEFGYDGEDFMSLDMKTWIWNYTERATAFTNKRDRFYNEPGFFNNLFMTYCPELLKKYLEYGNSSLQRKVLPSVSLLQKTPSSPVRCHATGFYPDRAVMLWRKDGEEIHEDVDHGEILPNHDGTFQMSVDLKLSNVSPEDWKRFDCVFQLSGVENNTIIRLDKAVIRTNWVKHSDTTTPIIMTVVFLVLVLIAATGFMFYKKKAPDSGSELYERLNPEI